LEGRPDPFPSIFESLASTAMAGSNVNDADRRIPVKKWHALSETLFSRDFEIVNSANFSSDKLIRTTSRTVSCRYYLQGFFYGYNK